MAETRIDRLARFLVGYSTAVRPGELVSLVGPPAGEALLVALYREVLLAGGHPLVQMVPEACAELLVRHAGDAQLAFVSPLEAREVELADVRVHVLAGGDHPPAFGDPARLAVLQQARRPLRELFLSRAAAKSLRWLVAQFPCPAFARRAGRTPADYEDLVYRAGLLDRPDPAAAWRAQSGRQGRLLECLAAGRELHVVTPAGTDLRVGVAGRTWVNGDGRENFPDGEVFTAPVEEATEGVARFDAPPMPGGRDVREVRLVFRAGRVVDASAGRGEDFLIALLDQDAGARVLGEIALGCNYALPGPTRNPLLDEKIGGTFHIALGAAHPASGGRNRSVLHWDLVGDLRPGGRVELDGRPVSVGGRFCSADWPQPGS